LTAILEQKPVRELVPTDIAFQTGYWGEIKSLLGCRARAFNFSLRQAEGDVLVIEQRIADDLMAAYVPLGPETIPDDDAKGRMLELLSLGLAESLSVNTVFLRWDLPWPCPYTSERMLTGHRPETRVRELRMNFGTENWKLRAAATNVLPSTTLLLDLTPSLDVLLERMKPKTRYNIRLARKKGVEVFRAPASMVPCFHDLYVQTATRDAFCPPALDHLSALFEPIENGEEGVETIMLLASDGEDLLAGAVVLFSGKTATYLHGASSNIKRSSMAPYALQWEILREAKARGCCVYDMFGASPPGDSSHPLQGVTRFKQGFGGRLFHRAGCWDYPLNEELYEAFRVRELVSSST
jgi:lipid II:glycine glycyltransferase (peptidoglycan interpeptide bridge formation enzyme)